MCIREITVSYVLLLRGQENEVIQLWTELNYAAHCEDTRPTSMAKAPTDIYSMWL